MALACLVVLALRVSLPLWHVLAVDHRWCGAGLEQGAATLLEGRRSCAAACGAGSEHLSATAGANPRPAAPGTGEPLLWRGASEPRMAAGCWLDGWEAWPEQPEHAAWPPLGRGLPCLERQLAGGRELIWAQTRHGLAPCLSPPLA